MSNNPTKRIVLANSYNAKSFANNDEEFLQEAAFNDVCKLIEEIKSNDNTCDTDDTAFYGTRGHYNVLVNGMRGSGKTTFALTAAGKLADEGSKGNKQQHKYRDIINLGVLDPTLIDTKEHVLLSVISKIKKIVESQKHNNLKNLTANESIFNRIPHPLDEWNNELRSLAQGLQQLDGVGKDTMQDSIWEDPVTIMQEGLDNVDAGLELNKRLHVFIEKSLKILEAKKFILVLDDIDTCLEKGWSVLESLRKFLTSPQLITLVCGDLQLYQALVKKQQWLQLGSLATEYEKDDKSRERHEALVSMLTEQYLLKVLPADRRVNLATTAGILNTKIYKNVEDVGSEKNADTLSDCIGNMLVKSFKISPKTDEGRLFIHFLSRKPIRMIIQLLTDLEGDELPVTTMQNIFSDWVYHEGAAALLQDSSSNPLLIQQLLGILGNSDIMRDDLELLPRYIDDLSNMGAVVSSRLLCDYFTDNPSAAIDFMIRGGISRQAVYFIGNKLETRPSADKIMHALSATTSYDLLTVTRQWAPVAVHGLSSASNISINRGTVQLLSEGTISKQRSKKALKNLYRTTSPGLVRAYASANISAAVVTKKSAYRALANGIHFLNAYYTQFKVKEQSQHYAISPIELKNILNNIGRPDQAELLGLLFVTVSQGNSNFYRATSLNLIAFINRLIALTNSGDGSSGLIDIEKIKSEFKRVSQIRTYPVPVDFSLLPEPNKENDEDDIDDSENEEYSQMEEEESESIDVSKPDIKFYVEVYDWLQTWGVKKNQINYPPFVWSRVWQRYYYTLEQQDNNLDSEHRFLGTIIHRQIIAFLNSVLVEELRYKKDSKATGVQTLSVSLDNPVNSDEIFIKNIKTIKSQVRKSKENIELAKAFPLYCLISNSPVWFSFLDIKPDDVLLETTGEIKGFTIDLSTNNDINSSYTLKDLINLIPLARLDHQIPSIWTHKDLKDVVMKKKNIKAVLKYKYEKFTPTKNVNKTQEFIREHLARTSSEATVKALEEIVAGKK